MKREQCPTSASLERAVAGARQVGLGNLPRHSSRPMRSRLSANERPGSQLPANENPGSVTGGQQAGLGDAATSLLQLKDSMPNILAMASVVPYRLSDEQYGEIYRRPEAYDYRYAEFDLQHVKPVYGLIFVTDELFSRSGNNKKRRVSNIGGKPTSASKKLTIKTLRTGERLITSYGQIRLPGSVSHNMTDGYHCYSRHCRDISPSRRTKWEDLPEEQKEVFKTEAAAHNQDVHRAVFEAAPEDLLVRYEMAVVPSDWEEGVDEWPDTVLIHFLGEKAKEHMVQPPKPLTLPCVKDASNRTVFQNPQTGEEADMYELNVQIQCSAEGPNPPSDCTGLTLTGLAIPQVVSPSHFSGPALPTVNAVPASSPQPLQIPQPALSEHSNLCITQAENPATAINEILSQAVVLGSR